MIIFQGFYGVTKEGNVVTFSSWWILTLQGRFSQCCERRRIRNFTCDLCCESKCGPCINHLCYRCCLIQKCVSCSMLILLWFRNRSAFPSIKSKFQCTCAIRIIQKQAELTLWKREGYFSALFRLRSPSGFKYLCEEILDEPWDWVPSVEYWQFEEEGISIGGTYSNRLMMHESYYYPWGRYWRAILRCDCGTCFNAELDVDDAHHMRGSCLIMLVKSAGCQQVGTVWLPTLARTSNQYRIYNQGWPEVNDVWWLRPIRKRKAIRGVIWWVFAKRKNIKWWNNFSNSLN